MTVYELTNPSDQYTLEVDDFLTACVTACVLGRGAYGLREVNGDRHMPPFIFGGHDEWFAAQFGQDFERCLNSVTGAQLADCLDSVLVGSAQDRQTYQAGLALIDDPAKRQAWRDRWHDQRRSSMNDIGGNAWRLAANIREAQPAG